MKMKYIETELLHKTWLAGIENVLFPSSLIKELHSQDILEKWDDLPFKREQYRDQVDVLIAKVIDSDTPEYVQVLLRKTDPKIVALYFDRLVAASFALDMIRQQMKVAEIPESWETTIRLLLFQKLFQ